jgi:hypothetical protein
VDTAKYWIFFPTSESLTILYSDRAPVDVDVTRTGKLGISANCKGFSKSTLLHVDSLGFESDFMSEVNLKYE